MSLPRAATTFTSLGFTDNVNVASTIHWDLGFKGFQLRCLLHAICVHTLSLVGSHCLVGTGRSVVILCLVSSLDIFAYPMHT